MVYWIIDWKRERVEVYERQGNQLVLLETLQPGDTLTSLLLPGFAMAVARLFA